MSTGLSTEQVFIRYRKLRSISPLERRFLAKALFWLPATALMLRLSGYRKTLEICNNPKSFAPNRHDLEAQCEVARMAARMVSVASVHCFTGAKCLQKSLVLVRLLSVCGIASTLVLGARHNEERFGAHAWVEVQGEVVNDHGDVDKRFSRFVEKSGRPD